MKPRGLLVVISSPSGGGKTTICERLLKKDPLLVRSISATTREPRGQERAGQDYFFMQPAAFARKAYFSIGPFMKISGSLAPQRKHGKIDIFFLSSKLTGG